MFIATTTKKAVCLYEGMLPRKKMEQFNAFLSVFYALSMKSCDLFRGGGETMRYDFVIGVTGHAPPENLRKKWCFLKLF